MLYKYFLPSCLITPLSIIIFCVSRAFSFFFFCTDKADKALCDVPPSCLYDEERHTWSESETSLRMFFVSMTKSLSVLISFAVVQVQCCCHYCMQE